MRFPHWLLLTRCFSDRSHFFCIVFFFFFLTVQQMFSQRARENRPATENHRIAHCAGIYNKLLPRKKKEKNVFSLSLLLLKPDVAATFSRTFVNR